MKVGVSPIEKTIATVAVVLGGLLGSVYLAATALEIAPGVRVLVWQLPLAGTLILAATGLLTRAVLMDLPVRRWLLLQIATCAVVLGTLASVGR